MLHIYVCVLSCARGRRAAFSRDAGAEEGGIAFWAGFFFFCPENRPWFPGTMQLMRASPRKIRLWHHGFLKHTAEPTLSPAIIKSQWISTVDWNWEKENLQFWSFTWVFLNTFFNLAANILELAPCSCTLHCIWLAVAIKLHTGLLVNFSW